MAQRVFAEFTSGRTGSLNGDARATFCSGEGWALPGINCSAHPIVNDLWRVNFDGITAKGRPPC